jgi:hypothetical protein
MANAVFGSAKRAAPRQLLDDSKRRTQRDSRRYRPDKPGQALSESRVVHGLHQIGQRFFRVSI